MSESEPEDRVSRAKRHLDQSNERVKKARIQAKKDHLQAQFLQAKERLDQAVLAVLQTEDMHELTGDRGISDLSRLRDKRQLLLIRVVEAEEAILDYNEDIDEL